MKKIIKFGAVLLIGGLIATFIGWRMGGAQPVSIGKNWQPKIVNEEVREKNLPTIKQIDLDVQDANVTVQRGQHYSIKLVDKNAGKPTYVVSRGTLTVTQTRSVDQGAGIDWQATPVHNIVITVPASADLNNVKINSDDGQVNLTDNYIESLTVNQSSGDLYATRGVIKHLTINNDDGNVHLTQIRMNTGAATLRDGNFEFDSGKVNDRLAVKNNDGTNRVNGVQAKGYYLRTNDGTNRLGSKSSQKTIKQNTTKTPFIKLVNSDGNNVVG